MSFLQAYYTSCETGLRGSKGFQINAATEGLDSSLLQQIERLGLYVPPVNAPSRPTAEQIEQFPVSLLYQRLEASRGVIAQAKYLGADYSGRFGNYFTHSLVSLDLTNDLTNNHLLPIEMWGSATWTTRESAATSLALIETPLKGSAITPQAVAEFLRDDDRQPHLSAFITAIEQALSTGKRLVIVADSEAVAYWIAVASYSLPAHLTFGLTFSTYVKNPYQTEFLLVGTTPDSDFNFAPHEIEHQYSVFDFHMQRFTPITQISDFAAQITEAFRDGDPKAIADFSLFVEQISPNLTVEELHLAFGCHAIISALFKVAGDTSRMIKWCADHLERFDDNQTRKLLAGIMDSLSVNGDVVEACTDLFLAAQAVQIDPRVREAVEVPYLQWLVRDLCANAVTSVLRDVAGRLHVPANAQIDLEPSRVLWMKHLRETDEPSRLHVLFVLGDKFGFLDTPDEIMRYLGRAKIGPWLNEGAVEQILGSFATKPAVRELTYGIAEFLSMQIARPQVFAAAHRALLQPEIVKTLVAYATEQRDLNLYFRLVGTQMAQPSCNAEARLRAFQQCLNGAQQFGSVLDSAVLSDAFAAIWQERPPDIDEAGPLLDVIERLQLADGRITASLADLLVVNESALADKRQQDLAQRLSSRRIFEYLGDRSAKVDAYLFARQLLADGDDSVNTLLSALDFLATDAGLLDQVSKATISRLVGWRMAHLKDEETHGSLLIRAYRSADRAFVFRGYEQEVITSLVKHSSGKESEVARLIRIWIHTERLIGNDLSNYLFEKILPQALRDWRGKHLDGVEKGLLKSRASHLRWIKWRERLKSQSNSGRRRWFPFR